MAFDARMAESLPHPALRVLGSSLSKALKNAGSAGLNCCRAPRWSGSRWYLGSIGARSAGHQCSAWCTRVLVF